MTLNPILKPKEHKTEGNVEFEIQVWQLDKFYLGLSQAWKPTKHSYITREDAEWMARYLELVKDIGITRVMEVRRTQV